jgi:hypothetical protein
MDDFQLSSLHESKNEWCSRLLTILTPHVTEGLRSIFDEAYKLCRENGELDKYLMTFQNFITRIPKWNASIIENERIRIVEKSGCGYLEDLVTCVHIIQLKILTAIRAGNKQKKININIPKLDDFIHKVYIQVARKIYKNVYLFEMDVPALQKQKYFREMEILVQESILNTVRESIPVESILQAYMDETVEEDVVEEIKEEVIEEPVVRKEDDEPGKSQIISEEPEKIMGESIGESKGGSSSEAKEQVKQLETMSIITEPSSTIQFNNLDYVRDGNNKEQTIDAPKSIERLEEISAIRNAQRKLEEEDDDSNPRLKIYEESIQLDNLDVHNIDANEISILPDLLLDDIEVLA